MLQIMLLLTSGCPLPFLLSSKLSLLRQTINKIQRSWKLSWLRIILYLSLVIFYHLWASVSNALFFLYSRVRDHIVDFSVLELTFSVIEWYFNTFLLFWSAQTLCSKKWNLDAGSYAWFDIRFCPPFCLNFKFLCCCNILINFKEKENHHE